MQLISGAFLSGAFLSLLVRVGLAAPRCTAAALVGDSEDREGSPWSTTVRCLWGPMSVVRTNIYSSMLGLSVYILTEISLSRLLEIRSKMSNGYR